MRTFIYANKGCYLTQSENNPHRPRLFFKALPVHYPDMWTNWTEEQYRQYIAEHGKTTIENLIQYVSQFDYSNEPNGIDLNFQ